ncbi:MAG: GIY-YIG nuclease family protein [Alphaproteobacteria bacterium]|nr:hypothetical protein [Rhodobiaceae bacterium]MBO6543734.1 GIY-YIG nuclease family protein [Alphaproteobacteria bacterium]MBO6629561.1 GIY-YIG nuclease family protein [Alphaproteobacteria bacterium]MDF1626629.1 GIY-YIG nuclease family protein [Parvibaculaceae bacterium]|tara:strand:+ start:634 stop:939 length:306 start_codon:yes stop_codon:yes gene_type:complete
MARKTGSRLSGKENTHRRWHMYVLECEGARLYTGITTDIERRLKAHQTGKGAKFTRSFAPRACLLNLEFEDRTKAARAEYDFKQLSAAEKRRFVATHQQPD